VKKKLKDDKNQGLKQKKCASPYYNKPVDTRDTAVQVRGVSQCAKNQNRTHTCDTRFGNTTGLPVPVTNPSPHTMCSN
jgi:hypothetical protein